MNLKLKECLYISFNYKFPKMAKKYDVVDFSEDKSKRLAEVLSNKTCRKILNYLKKKKSSETDISKALNLPLSTVHYNLKKLKQNNLINIKDFYWSNKGNKVNIYEAQDRMVVLSHKKPSPLQLKLIIPLVAIIAIIAVVNIFNFMGDSETPEIPIITPIVKQVMEEQFGEFKRFKSNTDLVEVFNDAIDRRVSVSGGGSFVGASMGGTLSAQAETETGSTKSYIPTTDFSETNIQVEGVDEADIIKTDGKYIYAVAQNKLIIAKAYPPYKSEIISRTHIDNFNPTEIFIDKDRLMVFGSSNYNSKSQIGEPIKETEEYPRNMRFTSVKLFDISDKENPGVLRTAGFEGDYLTSRKIDSDIYIVTNYHPRIYRKINDCKEIIPFYEEDNDIKPITKCTDIGYIEPVQDRNLIIIVSISMTDENKDIEKEVILGSGENIYASKENIYIAQTYRQKGEKTVITKFNLDNGKIEFEGTGKVKGHILNQFSMDEYDKHFRIATTSREGEQVNNLYVLDKDLNIIGELEDLAPTEQIYSVRYMGKRAYMVTFRKVDPLFVIDLSDHDDPKVLGKLKIPGYSDYLHPYDKNHIIGIGKEATESGLFQGIKMAIFDVSDVENPIEMYKEIIGDRGTHSEALHNHKAFLFDREKEVVVIPIYLRDNESDFREGVYIYNINLKEGFELRGRIEIKNPRRNLYIENTLYTMSNYKIQVSSILTAVKIKDLVF